MKTIIDNYLNYNLWANKTLLDLINDNYKSMLDSEVNSSFKSLRKTIYHIWDAEYAWKKRIEGESISDFLSKTFSEKTDLNLFIENSKMFKELIVAMQQNQLENKIKYNNIKGEPFENSVSEIVHHCMNHSTFHRGQIISILRILGADNLPSTDFVTWLRIKK